MAVFKCKMCGAQLPVTANETVTTCAFCGSRQTVSNADDERKEHLFNRANSFRRNNEFDKALLAYQTILATFPHEPEAYWGIVLSKYGIEYITDTNNKRKPTIHRMAYDSILKDSDYLETLKYADVVAKEQYQDEANEIANIQKSILQIAQKEQPFEIFICYKETDENGKRTPDSVMAQEIYQHLVDKKYKVFFSRITLENILGTMYEPYIFSALHSAKVMLVIGTKPQYFEAVWVRNEWSRFLSLVKTSPGRYIIPCYKDMDAYNMPEELLSFQAQDLSRLGFMQDLMRGVDKILGRDEGEVQQAATKIISTGVNVEALLTRAEILISDGDFVKADEILEQVLNNEPKNSKAYLFKLLVELQLRTLSQLKSQSISIKNKRNFTRAYSFANSEQKIELDKLTENLVPDKGPYTYGEGHSFLVEFPDGTSRVYNSQFKYMIGAKVKVKGVKSRLIGTIVDYRGSASSSRGTEKIDGPVLSGSSTGSSTSSSRNSSKGGCYIATAIYGTYDTTELWVLRRYRDQVLSRSVYGRTFVKIYYIVSPTFVKLFGKTKLFNFVFKKLLDRKVKKLHEQGVKKTPYDD